MSGQDTVDWSNLHGVMLFLSCFRTRQSCHEVADVADWPLAFPGGADPDRMLQRLMADGHLELAEADEPTTVAVKVIDMLGEEVLVTQEV